MFYQVFAAYRAAEFAMQIQQQMLRLFWVNPWLMAMTPAAGSGRTEPVQTMQERRPGNREALDAQCKSARAAEGATIQVPVQREEMVIERQTPTGELVEEIRIPVSEEQVTVEKRPVVKEEVT